MTGQIHNQTLPTAAYIHIPFCKAKCFYCDFNSYPGMEKLFSDYIDAVLTEITSAGAASTPLDSIYFGGGTPTLLSCSQLASILGSLNPAPDAEITIEANPGTVTLDDLTCLHQSGFNRLSMGVQSFDDAILRRIGRIHTADEARTAYRFSREVGFSNISIDLIYALPEQTTIDWKNTLNSTLNLRPEHISLYELTVEEGTVFGNLRRECQLNLPDEDTEIEMYQIAISELTSAGYEHYEISNFALPGCRSRHNQVYWRNEPYYGFGAGASGYIGGVRYTNMKLPGDYISRIRSGGSAVESSESVTGRQAMGETVMLGLRMMDGLDLTSFRARYGIELSDVYGTELSRLLSDGLVEIADDHLRLTPSGLLVANNVSAEFL